MLIVCLSTGGRVGKMLAALRCLRPRLSLQVVSVDELGHGIRDFNKGALGSWNMGLWLT